MQDAVVALAVKIGGQTVLELLDHKVRLLHIASEAFPPQFLKRFICVRTGPSVTVAFGCGADYPSGAERPRLRNYKCWYCRRANPLGLACVSRWRST